MLCTPNIPTIRWDPLLTNPGSAPLTSDNKHCGYLSLVIMLLAWMMTLCRIYGLRFHHFHCIFDKHSNVGLTVSMPAASMSQLCIRTSSSVNFPSISHCSINLHTGHLHADYNVCKNCTFSYEMHAGILCIVYIGSLSYSYLCIYFCG